MLSAWDAGRAAGGQPCGRMGTGHPWHCLVRLAAWPWCGSSSQRSCWLPQGQLCRDPRHRQGQTLLQSRNCFSPLKMFQSKDPTDPLSSRCKTRIGNKGLLGVITMHSLQHFAGVGKQKTASGDPCRGTSRLAPSPRVHGM